MQKWKYTEKLNPYGNADTLPGRLKEYQTADAFPLLDPSAGKPMYKAFAERLKDLKDFAAQLREKEKTDFPAIRHTFSKPTRQ